MATLQPPREARLGLRLGDLPAAARRRLAGPSRGRQAGDRLGALTALIPHEQDFQPGFETADTAISAAVCEGEWPPSTPLPLDAGTAPPVLLAHGTNDTHVRAHGARAFASWLRKASVTWARRTTVDEHGQQQAPVGPAAGRGPGAGVTSWLVRRLPDAIEELHGLVAHVSRSPVRALAACTG